MDHNAVKHIVEQYMKTTSDSYKSIADTIQGISNYNYSMALTQHSLECKRTEFRHYACDFIKSIPKAVLPRKYDAPDGTSYNIQFTIGGCRDFHLFASVNESNPMVIAVNIIQDR